MIFSIKIIEQLAPIFISVLAAIPFLFIYVFNKQKEKTKFTNHYWLIIYLIILVIAACAFVLLKGTQIMCVDDSNRSLFICSILIVGCVDQILNLLPLRRRLQFDLVSLLTYSIALLCSVPLLWQILRHIISPEISSKADIMRAAEIALMLVMVILCVSCVFIKQSIRKIN